MCLTSLCPYKQKKKLILIDECVTTGLAKYLRGDIVTKRKSFKPKRIDATIISVKETSTMQGMRDYDLGKFCSYYNGILITEDKKFLEEYKGYKIKWEKTISWFSIYQKINYFFSNPHLICI